MKKKIVLGIITILISALPIINSKGYFKSKDENNDNYIKTGSFDKNQFKDVSMFAYVAKGPALTFGVEIKKVVDRHLGEYYSTSRLSSYPYDKWSFDRKNEIAMAIAQTTNQDVLQKINTNFAKSNDPNYFVRNRVTFGGNFHHTFVNDQGIHVFVAICNNAHLIDNAKKINIQKETKLNIQDTVTFTGNATHRVWNTNYKRNIDIYNDRYYVTTAYIYDKNKNEYKATNRGSWYFYNSADLIIIDLGATGHMEDEIHNWRYSPRAHRATYSIFNKMKKRYNGQVDDEAFVTKANYKITFTPSWDDTKTLKQTIRLGKD